jgi:serine protease Do
MAIGNPLGQKFTVTAGIISAENRQLGMGDQQNALEDFLQTDAAINMGNSGGPLINLKGEAIGINSNILTPNSGNIGIGFAIPSNMAKKVVGDLKTKGKVTRGFFGITFQYLNEKAAKEYDQTDAGALVVSVEDNSPALRAGIKRYDLIIEANGKPIKSAADLQREIANSNPGDSVAVTLIRNGKKVSLKVSVAEAPQNLKLRGREGETPELDLGLALEKNSPSLKREYELKTSDGLVVHQIDRRGMAYAQGLRQGDVLLQINRTELTSVEQFERLISAKEPGTSVLLLINRFGEESVLRFAIPEQ